MILHAEKFVRPQAAKGTALGWSGTAPAARLWSHPATVEASRDADISAAPLGIAGIRRGVPRHWLRLGR